MIKATSRIETTRENAPESRDFTGLTRKTVERANEALELGAAKLARKPLQIETLLNKEDPEGEVREKTIVRQDFFRRLAALGRQVQPASEKELESLVA